MGKPQKEKKPQGQQNRKAWFKAFRKLMVGRYKRPEFIYLGKPFDKSAIIVSNHEGTDAPLSLELYCDAPLRFWGANEMNSNVVALYKYQTKIYYCEKKHWHPLLAYSFCLIASPLTYLFYRGLRLISTYRDIRFKRTLDESIETLKNGESIVIFPENSAKGYLRELEGFFPGFVMLAEVCYARGMDLPIYVTYFKREELQYIIDAPVLYSELVARYGKNREVIADVLVKRCNELGLTDPEELKRQADRRALEAIV